MATNTIIDNNSPLYLHPSDGSNSVVIERLEGSSNYRPWRRSFELAVTSKRKMGFITGSVERDKSDKVKQDAWDTCNSMVITWMLNNVNDSIKRSVMYLNSARQIWDQLEIRYQVSNGSRKYQLNKQIYEIRQDGRGITEYFTQLKVLWEELDTMNTLPVISQVNMNAEVMAFVTALEKREETKLFQFLNGLDEIYGVQRSHLVMMKVLPTVDEACSILMQEESQREVVRQPREESDGAAMLTKNETMTCTTCGKKGHNKEKCWTIIGYPSWMNKGSSGEGRSRGRESGSGVYRGGRSPMRGSRGGRGGRTGGRFAGVRNVHKDTESSSGFTEEQIEQLLKLLPGSSKSGKDDGEEDFECNMASMIRCNYAGQKEESLWIIDSGASDHMTGFFDKLQKIEKINTEAKIGLPTGETTALTHKGEVVFKNQMKLKNVVFVPKFRHNLISVHKLVSDLECKAVFRAEYCIVTKEKNGELVTVGRAHHGLYYLMDMASNNLGNYLKEKIMEKPKIGRRIAFNAATNQTQEQGVVIVPDKISDIKRMSKGMLWHQRLGHIPMERLRKIQEIGEKEKRCTEECIICPEAKFTKLPWNHSESQSKELFDLIHLDIWGPYREYTRKKERYFLTIVEDKSRVTWVHLLRSKGEAYQAIEDFVKMTETQFGKKVKAIRSDNAKEFYDEKCKELYSDLGILHQTSCVDRPQQNGREERRHRNILEMSRALRFQSGLPLWMWGDCVQCAAFITNRVPTRVLAYKTPYEENVYMRLPPGYEGKGERIKTLKEGEQVKNMNMQSNVVCKLQKSLYGLKQAPRKWFDKLSQALLECDFQQSKSDHSLFTRQRNGSMTIILVYVDDMLIGGDNMKEIQLVKEFLSSKFKMKDIGKVRYFLGIEIDQNKDGIYLSQKKYVNDLLKEYGIVNCRKLKLPLDSHTKLLAEQGEKLPNPEAYQNLVGKLIYLSLTRPDIAYTVHTLSKFMHCPTSVHMQAAKRVLRYLAGTSQQGILFAAQERARLEAFCDRKSPISWKSKRQSVVARSTAEAEYGALALVVCEVMWVKQLLTDLGMKQDKSTVINCDNQAALAIVANPIQHERTKHVEIDFHFIRDKAKQGEITPQYVPSAQQVPDLFTKVLPVDKHRDLQSKMGVQFKKPSLLS